MRIKSNKVLAAATLAACMLFTLPAYGAQGSVVEPRPETVQSAGENAAVGTNVTVANEADAPEDNGTLHITSTGSGKSQVRFDEDDAYVDAGPGAVKNQEPDKNSGESLGTFTITGYCGCDACSGGHNLTYSGTTPQPDHTISADLNLFPLGTKLLIDGTVYTVEDMGSAMNGRKLDIYYATHDEALAAGMYTAEVFRAD